MQKLLVDLGSIPEDDSGVNLDDDAAIKEYNDAKIKELLEKIRKISTELD